MDKERVKKLIRELIIEIGEDPTREGLKDTPRRIADGHTVKFLEAMILIQSYPYNSQKILRQ